jgi:signal transduction histidine kinase
VPNSKRSSLRVRVTLAASTFVALVSLVVSALVLVSMHKMEDGNRRYQTMDSITRLLFHVENDLFPRPLVGEGDEQIQVLNARGQVVTATRKLAGKPPMATFQPAGGQLRVRRTLCPPAGLEGCMTVVAYQVFRPDGTWMIYAALPAVPWYVNPTLAIFLGVMNLLFIAMTGMLAWRAVSKTLAPVDAIRATMDQIKATDLDQRVPVPTDQNEIRMLAESVNSTLDRLNAAYDQLRRFTADASHEVRSPLTAIRTQVEEALMYPDDTDWPQVGQAVHAAVERLQALMTDLLVLARLDAGVSLTVAPTDLGQMVEDQLNHRTYSGKVIRNLPEGVFASCEQVRIARLLSNLLDNAERHATSQITVTVRAEGRWAVLEVTDDGAGIPADAREMVFRRFTRLDTARNRDAGGSGLGLAIARQIAEVHGGTLTIQDSEQGARFVLRLPRDDR